jgi:hypothetical protein
MTNTDQSWIQNSDPCDSTPQTTSSPAVFPLNVFCPKSPLLIESPIQVKFSVKRSRNSMPNNMHRNLGLTALLCWAPFFTLRALQQGGGSVRQEEECAAPPSQLYHGGSSIVFEGSHHLQCVHERGCVWTCCMNVCLSIPCPDTFPVLFHFPATGLVCSRWPPTLGSSPLPDVRNLQLTSQLQQLLVSPYQCLRRQ